jgi:hypothetical protein
VLGTRTGRPSDAPIPLGLGKTPAFAIPPGSIAGEWLPDYLSPQPVERFRCNRQDRKIGIRIGGSDINRPRPCAGSVRATASDPGTGISRRAIAGEACKGAGLAPHVSVYIGKGAQRELKQLALDFVRKPREALDLLLTKYGRPTVSLSSLEIKSRGSAESGWPIFEKVSAA